MKLHNLVIFVPDFKTAKEFYIDILGFVLKTETENSLVLDASNIELHIFRCEKQGAAGDYSNESRAVFVFEVASIEETMKMLQGKGVKVLHDTPGENSSGKYIAFVDPFGIVHEILEPVN